MKLSDVKKYKIGNHCFGPILSVNDVDYEDMDKNDVLDIINDTIQNDINNENFIMEVFLKALEYSQLEVSDSKGSYCDQCGSHNEITTYGGD